PHCITFVNDVQSIPVDEIGPKMKITPSSLKKPM
ncbi:unnamed protein product, partial [marine sediment metagenome]